MNSRPLFYIVILSLLVFCLFSLTALKAEPAPESLQSGSTFMRHKLKAVGQIVEGLTTEDFQLISSGGEQLLKLSEDAAWRVPRDPMYMHYSSAFQTNVNELMKASKRESIGDATLSYINLTVSCMACHKHVRGVVRVAPANNAAGIERTFN